MAGCELGRTGTAGEIVLCDARLQSGPKVATRRIADGAEKPCAEATFGQSSEEKNG